MQGIDKSSIKSHCWREWRCCCSTHCRWILHSKVGSYEAKAYESVTSTWLVTIGLSVRNAGGPVVHAYMYDAMRRINYEVTTFVLQQRAPERCKNHAAFAFTQFYAPIPLTNFISKYLPTTANSCKNPNVTLSGCPEVNKINAYLFSSFLGIFSSDWIPHW